MTYSTKNSSDQYEMGYTKNYRVCSKSRTVLNTIKTYNNGTEEWYHKGVLHRTDGPAITYPNGMQFYFLEGMAFSKREFLSHPLADKSYVLKNKIDEILEHE